MKRSRSQDNGRTTDQAGPLAKAKKKKKGRNSLPPLDDSDQQQGRQRNRLGDQKPIKQQPSSDLVNKEPSASVRQASGKGRDDSSDIHMAPYNANSRNLPPWSGYQTADRRNKSVHPPPTRRARPRQQQDTTTESRHTPYSPEQPNRTKGTATKGDKRLGKGGDPEDSRNKPCTGDTKDTCPKCMSPNIQYDTRDNCECHLCENWRGCKGAGTKTLPTYIKCGNCSFSERRHDKDVIKEKQRVWNKKMGWEWE